LFFAGLEEVSKPEFGGVRLTSRKGVQCRDEQRQGVMPETETERQVTELTETEHRERPETTAESLERLTERSWEESATEAELIGLEAETSPTEVLWVQAETTEEGRALDEIAAVLELESVKANTGQSPARETAIAVHMHDTGINEHIPAITSFGKERGTIVSREIFALHAKIDTVA